MKTTILEACTDCVQSAINAQKGGADRIELCSNLVIGGLTPGKALFDLVKKYTNIKTRVLLRPRYGDYCYDQYEFEQLKEEVKMYCEMGADGVVIGMLNPDGTLDTEHMAELIKAAGNKEKALHRAFDVCIDPMKALEEAIELGFDTILTSGQKETAWEGREMLKALQEKSAGRIEKLLPYTGITSYHMSGKIVVDSAMKYRKEGIGLGLSERGDYALWQTSEEEIVKAVKVLKTID